MKCKNWSNKINNFVVLQLKAFKINGQQQVIPTMPAMPKEKTIPVPLTESNFTEMKIKEQLVGGCGVGISCTPSKSSTVSSSSTNDLLLTSTTNDIDTAAGTTNFITYRGDNKMANNLTSSMANTTGNLNNYNNSELNNSITSIKSATIPSSSSSPIAATATTTTTATSSSINNINVANDGVSITPPTVTSSSPTTTTTTTTTPRPSGPVKKSAQDYIFGRYIGEGSFSTVYLARDVYTGKNYAIKVCDKQHILREKKQEYIRREREIMHIMNNVPGFVNLTCTFQDTRSLYFVMTYAKNGDLLPYINKVGSFDLDCTRHYAAELVIAIENMHKRNVVHRDLKPENILLDENMHTLIADFGSAKVLSTDYQQSSSSSSSAALQNETADTTTGTTTITTTTTTTSSPASSNNDSENSSRHHHHHNQRQQQQHNHSNYHNNKNSQQQQHQSRRRRGSFVGTAQYVSPEVLQGDTITKAADLWALGCIIYQMISGLPPFRGGSDYLIFKEIMNLNLVFPEGFDKDAEDLVRNLIKIHPEERIGAQDKCGRYESIRTHKFFHGINWETVQIQTPPPIYPYLPGVHKDDELRSHYRVPDNLEPGLDDKQLTRLLGLELGTVTSIDFEKKTEPKKNILNISEIEKQRRLEQQKTDRWNQFVDGEIIIKKGYINKRKGLFARKRMLLLTTGPRLIYVDPVQMVKKGEIPWGPELRVEPKNFKIFFVHTTNPKKLTSTSSFSTIKSLLHPTFKSWSKQDENNQLYLCLQPNRTYYLEDPEGFALEWVEAIEDVRQKTYKS